jgi:hypothetical protein
MRRSIFFLFFQFSLFSLTAQDAREMHIGKPNPNKVVELQENIAEVRDIYRRARVKVVKEFYRADSSAKPQLVSKTWVSPEGRITKKAFFQGRDTLEVNDFYYNPNGMLARTVNRTSGMAEGVFVTDYAYDERGRLATVKGSSPVAATGPRFKSAFSEVYEYDGRTGQISSVTRTSGLREKFVFSTDSASNQLFKACYRLPKDSDFIAPDLNPHTFFVLTFDREGEIYMNECYEQGELVFWGEYVYMGPGRYMATRTRELPYPPVRTNYTYAPIGVLTQIQSTDGSLVTFEYEQYK